ncbi:hypothetical protein GGX14DRAFT_408447 [Mycena pura]|uniref:Uncharacterized protein n=1 Tax=Mycena pura TaxID=153505 RepID=A0AAD6ULT0_9AGAR|nr:hypothetical protein GGX14DRAFT_408447 [Mycena pura]
MGTPPTGTQLAGGWSRPSVGANGPTPIPAEMAASWVEGWVTAILLSGENVNLRADNSDSDGGRGTGSWRAPAVETMTCRPAQTPDLENNAVEMHRGWGARAQRAMQTLGLAREERARADLTGQGRGPERLERWEGTCGEETPARARVGGKEKRDITHHGTAVLL